MELPVIRIGLRRPRCHPLQALLSLRQEPEMLVMAQFEFLAGAYMIYFRVFSVFFCVFRGLLTGMNRGIHRRTEKPEKS